MQLDRATFHTWLRDARLLEVKGAIEPGDLRHEVREASPGPIVFVIGVRNTYALEQLQHRLYRNIRRVLTDSYGQPVELEFQIHKPEPVPEAPKEEELPLLRLLAQAQHQPEVDPVVPLHRQVPRPQRTDLQESDLNPRYQIERLV